MPYHPQNPLIVQSDRSLLLEVQNPHYEAARDALGRFAELVKSPEFIHTYQITPLSLWNAAAAGEQADDIVAALEQFAKFDLPPNIITDIHDYMSRYGRLRLCKRDDDGALLLESDDHQAQLRAACVEHGLDPMQVQHETDPSPLMEGLYIKAEAGGVVTGRSKYIRAGFLAHEQQWNRKCIFSISRGIVHHRCQDCTRTGCHAGRGARSGHDAPNARSRAWSAIWSARRCRSGAPQMRSRR
jgi:hypothetical protein